jgi:multiple sugar transport system ATP-binding protein
MASVKLEHIYKVYPNGTKAVNDISLDIKNGEFIVFVGPSGCGKSTTLRMIAGLEDITAGELYIDNQIVNDVEPKDRDIAMVFQNYALYPHMTVYENMAFGLKLRHIPNDVIQEKVLWAADILGIKEYLDRKPKAMSGGQRQRVALGRAILRDPKVMLLDEPLSNLDAKLRTQMRTEIAKLHQKLKTTFIYVTHDQTEAMTLGDRVVVMKLGRLQQVDTPKNLYNYPSNKFVAGFIGTPQMNFFGCTLLRDNDKVIANIKINGIKVSIDYNALIKVNPNYLDGKYDIIMGVRCEHVRIVNKDTPDAIPVKVSHFEELGADCLVYGSLNLKEDTLSEKEGSIIIKVLDIGDIKPNSIIYVAFDMNNTYYFDAKTEETIVPTIPSYNSFFVSVKNNIVNVLNNQIKLPKALETVDLAKAELRIPSDAFILNKDGIKAKVLNTEIINDKKLVHFEADGRIFFALLEDDVKDGQEVSLGIDFTRISIIDGNKEIIAPINALDSLSASFLNYQTVISKDNDPEFVKFRQDKIDAASKYMDAQILLENQNYEKSKLENSNVSNSDAKDKEQKKFNDIKANNTAAIAKIKAETKATLKEETAKFKAKKKQLTDDNNKLFADKKAKEEAEFKAFKAYNKDRDSLKRRTDEYHIFKDNYQSDKENTLNLGINGVTMDYESNVSSLKASTRRQVDILKKEISDEKKVLNNILNPEKNLEKTHKQTMKKLVAQKQAAIRRAGLVFFFQFDGDYYSMTTDIISNKLVQGLGTRVFSKEFKIDVPHDAFRVSTKKNSFVCKVEANLDYGNTYYVRCGYTDSNGESKKIFLTSSKPMTIGDNLALDLDISRVQITETSMNIRLY